MRRFIITVAAATAFVAGALFMGGGSAGAAPVVAPGATRAAADGLKIVESVQFIWLGHNYCWYDDAWQGPGWYWCGYAFRNGLGWGGGYGWHNWRGGHAGGGAVARGGRAGGGAVVRGGRAGGGRAGGGRAGGGHGGGGHGGGGHGGGGHGGGGHHK